MRPISKRLTTGQPQRRALARIPSRSAAKEGLERVDHDVDENRMIKDTAEGLRFELALFRLSPPSHHRLPIHENERCPPVFVNLLKTSPGFPRNRSSTDDERVERRSDQYRLLRE